MICNSRYRSHPDMTIRRYFPNFRMLQAASLRDTRIRYPIEQMLTNITFKLFVGPRKPKSQIALVKTAIINSSNASRGVNLRA